jgi:hypothetical protein
MDKQLHGGHFEDPSPNSIITPHSCKAVLAGIYCPEMELSFARGNKLVVAKHISSDTNQPTRYTTSKMKMMPKI